MVTARSPAGWDALEIRAAGGEPLDGAHKLASVLAADAMWDALDVMRRERLAAGAPDISLREAMGRLQADGLVPHDGATLDWHLELLAREDAGCWAATLLSLLAHDEGVDVYGYGDSVIASGFGACPPSGWRSGSTCGCRRRASASTRHELTMPPLTATESFDADVVVVTVPLGVSKSGAIEFVPNLPASKRRAIERIGVGVLAKLVLRFDDVWWPPDQYVIGVTSRGVADADGDRQRCRRRIVNLSSSCSPAASSDAGSRTPSRTSCATGRSVYWRPCSGSTPPRRDRSIARIGRQTPTHSAATAQ